MTRGSCKRRGFTRHHRLLKASDFERVFAAPRRSRDRFFTVLACDNGLAYPRLGIAVGKKHVRRAVGRNRIKRLVRESFRHHAARLGGVDLVVVNRSDGAAASELLRRSLESHWKRLAAACDEQPSC